MNADTDVDENGLPSGLVPGQEELRAEILFCMRRAKAAHENLYHLPRARDLQEYWNHRAYIARLLCDPEVFMALEDEAGWSTRGGSRGTGTPLRK